MSCSKLVAFVHNKIVHLKNVQNRCLDESVEYIEHTHMPTIKADDSNKCAYHLDVTVDILHFYNFAITN
jgi:hypothetical protein